MVQGMAGEDWLQRDRKSQFKDIEIVYIYGGGYTNTYIYQNSLNCTPKVGELYFMCNIS